MFKWILRISNLEFHVERLRRSLHFVKSAVFQYLAQQHKPEAMYTESAFRREELEGSGGEKQPEEGMESAEILRNICEKDVTLFRTAHSKDLNSVSWALRTLVEREPETFFRYL